MLLWLTTVRSIVVLVTRTCSVSLQPHQGHGVFVGVTVERMGGKGSGHFLFEGWSCCG